jgi:EAL domain-containing protein (putative c-di-GMP-specific phosphodiesterase class I)
MGRAKQRVHTMKSAQLPNFNVAFQPIVNVRTQQIIAYEALTRGSDGTPFPELIAGMDLSTIRRFHRQTARVSIRRAMELGLFESDAALCINMQPDLSESAVTGEFILEVAKSYGVCPGKILLELTEDHHLTITDLRQLVARNQSAGFVTGMDDFGAGYSGLTMLVECRPEVLKLDRALVRGIDHCEMRTKVVAAFAQISSSLNMILVAEGVETVAECTRLQELGIDLMQGFLFSRPVVDALPVQEVWGVAFPPRVREQPGPMAHPLSWLQPRRDPEPITLRAECA